VRKRLKRLRYLAGFARPRFKDRRVDEFLEAIEAAQDALGEYNDAATARDAYRALAQKDPSAWFGAGWLKARDALGAQECERALKAFAKAHAFWN
jgi:CHAD domain-containing protein